MMTQGKIHHRYIQAKNPHRTHIQYYTMTSTTGGGGGSPIIESFAVPPLGCNCTIIGDATSRDCICIDPGGNVNKILQKISSHNLTLRRVLITHGHLDHIIGGKELKLKTGCDIIMHQDDLTLYENVVNQCRDFGIEPPSDVVSGLPKPDEFITDGDIIQWSPSYKVECIHCPGHSPGSMSYHIPECQIVCVGDTLFEGSVGRTSWAGIPSLQGTSDAQQLQGSIKYKLFQQLSPETVVICGHGGQTTIGEEQQYNPYVR